MIVLVPAYEPDHRLVDLVASVRSAAPELRVLVVDDGSGPGYERVFDAVRGLGGLVLDLPVNRGKGYALKAGFAHADLVYPGEDVVCADCDGQHSVVDILRVAGRIGRTRPSGSTDRGTHTDGAPRPAMVLGARRFTGQVPTRSRVGNATTRALFRAITRVSVQDTQTGLRGYPASMLPWLRSVPGDRFEYELNLLLHARGAGYGIEEVEIATIYLEENASSHFRPVADSVRIYAPLLRFSLSSLGAFALDTVALLVLHTVTGSLVGSVVGARVVSSGANFLANRRLVFDREHQTRLGPAAAHYWALVVVLLAANALLISALTHAGTSLLLAKVVTEAVLFVVSFQAQRRFVFRPGTRAPARRRAAAGLRDEGRARDGGAPTRRSVPSARR
ncbi:bifunctional glycosyltransferase family 2/GtrA family protein [Sanguibacter sp. 25GB23B1]|uniref:bifunctional glycosyltransferase family 2/GtrA family protein n=1 Tax=unclassified Sanguibacter TaxID=2645534 RepID=UPI0032AEB0C3